MSTHHTPRRFGGKIAALAVGAALALAPSVATAAPAPSLGTAPLAPAANVTAGPVAGFEDNAARAVYWLADATDVKNLGMWSALAFAGAGYGEAVRDDVLAWAKEDGLNAAFSTANKAQLAQVIGVYGEDPATFLDVDLEQVVREALDDPAAKSIYVLPFYMYALQYTDDGVPAEAVDMLRDLQCLDENSPNFGSFSWSTCGQYDMDGTSWAIQAFIAAGVDADDPAVQAAADFVRGNQIENGGFENDVMGTIVANTNTSGLAVQALRAIGDDENANRGAQFIASLQAGWDSVGAVPAGIIAYDASGFEGFKDGELTGQEVMASEQAMLAFGSQSFAGLSADGSISELPVAPLVAPKAYGQTTDEDALLVAHWLQEEITENDGLMPNFGAPDWGITLDALISLAALGTGTDAADIALERFAEEGETYIDYGLSQSAKSAYVLLVYGEDPRTFFDGRDLLQELRDGIEADGAVGEFADAFGQAFALLVFERTAEGSPSESIQWLEDQQCLETGHVNYGGYGMPWEPGTTSCDVADADTTGLVVQALSAADVDTDAESIAAGLDWLAGNLNSEGAIEAWGAPSANSTSWAAQAFGAFGKSQADGARSFLKDQVIKASDVDNQDALVEADAGLVPSSPFDRVQAFEDGTGGIMDGARFATAQTGFGLGGYSLAEITALGASTAAPAPEFAQVDDGEGAQKPDGSGSNNTASKDDEGEAAQPQKHQPSYAG